MQVWFTRGIKYHSQPNCQALLDGQAKAASEGKQTYPPQFGPLAKAHEFVSSDVLQACMHCWPKENGWEDWLPLDLAVESHAGTPTGSLFELDFYRSVLRDLPGLERDHVKAQHEVRTRDGFRYPDFVIDIAGLRPIALEIDGHEKSPRAREDDRERGLERDAALQAAGYRVEHFTNQQVRMKAAWCREQVQRFISEERDRSGQVLPAAPEPIIVNEMREAVTPLDSVTTSERPWYSRPGVISVGVLVLVALCIGGAFLGFVSRSGSVSSEDVSGQCGADYPVRGNVSRSGDRIYHLPGWRYYDATDAEECFATSSDAEKDGYRPSQVR